MKTAHMQVQEAMMKRLNRVKELVEADKLNFLITIAVTSENTTEMGFAHHDGTSILPPVAAREVMKFDLINRLRAVDPVAIKVPQTPPE